MGSQVFESTFDFKVDIRIGAGAFVCGEETALIHSIEGGRGTPRTRPPYPAQSGLDGCPTLINNVESYANIAAIIREGAAWYANIGTASSKGTKIFALTGKIRNNGLIEVPMGITLREIVEEMGGGIPDGQVKAVQTGGPSGGCIPANLLDTPVDYESLAKLGSMMDSGGWWLWMIPPVWWKWRNSIWNSVARSPVVNVSPVAREQYKCLNYWPKLSLERPIFTTSKT